MLHQIQRSQQRRLRGDYHAPSITLLSMIVFVVIVVARFASTIGARGAMQREMREIKK
jgi:hypothetical protein